MEKKQALFEDIDEDIPFIDQEDEIVGESTQNFIEDENELIGDLTQNFWEDDDEIIGEPTQSFFEASPIFQGMSSPQVGSGNEVGSENKLENAIIITEKSRRHNIKYQGQQIIFEARVDPDRLPSTANGVPMITILGVVRELFEMLIARTTSDLAPVDLIRFCIQSDDLDVPISTTLMRVSDLTVEKILAAVLKVLQSKKHIKLDTTFSVDVVTIRRPVGAGRRRFVNPDVDKLLKTSILAIPSDDLGLCCAKAIVFALAHLHADVTAINALKRKDRPALTTRAMDLHKAAGVPLGPCTYREIAIFEQHLNVQIVVFSSENLNKVSYKGQNRPERINLYLHQGHYDVIKGLKGFYSSNFYCEHCEKPFNNRENHRCPEACYICLRRECLPGENIRCTDCGRLCRSTDCFDTHKACSSKQQKSLCDKVYQCDRCCKVIQRQKCPRELHRCGTTMCPSCEAYVVASEHRCFLKKVAPKTPNEKLIFFDFETDQASGEHKVNFALAQYQDKTEKVFKGYSACHDFCSWLFSPEHKGYTAIAHNMKG
ncbi:uncharacterized protein LOC129218306 [Uloborus diversus]|uniref:uncharacterized protein LOC129218306 n=1 Tax=Uloborus diversus TaxID=327109 RepID=UPI00240A752E|nr:uncharacterized protein LOC129218306 [Uloborus diversus]